MIKTLEMKFLQPPGHRARVAPVGLRLAIVVVAIFTGMLMPVRAQQKEPGSSPATNSFNFKSFTSPILFEGDAVTAYRDPAAIYHNGIFYLYFTLVKIEPDGTFMFTAFSKSRDLAHWTEPQIITPRDRSLNFSSPGNIIRFGDQWVLCLQTYPRPNGSKYGSNDCRLWIRRSTDLEHWSEPELLRVKGPLVTQAEMGRMIDPYLIEDKDALGQWWCFFKQNGASRAWSRDLKTWTYAGHIPAGENVCVLRDGAEYVMFHSPSNGIGVKRSSDLQTWRDTGLLTLGQTNWPWAQGRLTAGFVLDLRDQPGIGKHILFFHGSAFPEEDPRGGFDNFASIGFAWSDDLIHWSWPGQLPSGLLAPVRLLASAQLPAVNDLPVQAALPDPLLTVAGEKITTVEQWARRRVEMKQIIQYYETGHIPPPPGNVIGKKLWSQKTVDGQTTCRHVRLTFGPEGKLELDLAILIPAETGASKSPFPTIVQPSFTPIFGTNSISESASELTHSISDAALEELASRYRTPLKRGYAVVTFDYQQCGVDRPDFRQTGFFPAYPDYDWGTLAAWAWGMSRCVDYLQTQPFADASKLIALGHSRLGKAALIAGAWDERFALTAPAGSGCGGTGAYRFNGKGRGGKEGLEDATKRFPRWFVPRLAEFSGQVEKLPFDQHWLLALVAPRGFIAADALADPYANGNALAQSYLAAKPVYALLGVPDRLGINFRPGGHLLAAEDWQAILDFSDQQLRGLKIERRFDQLPPSKDLH